MENSFELLEQKVQKAVARLRELQAENRSLRGELQAAAVRVQKAELAVRAVGEQATVPKDDGRAEAAARELAELRRERDEIRRRIGKLVELLEKL